MSPETILNQLSEEKITSIFGELNSGQLKSVLRAGGLKTKVPSACVLQKARRRIWSRRIKEGLEDNKEGLADELIYQWLLHHRRPMLMDYLDSLGIKHIRGETEESFTKTVPENKLLDEAQQLMERHDPQDVAIYTLFLDHHQGSEVFETNPLVLGALSGKGSETES